MIYILQSNSAGETARLRPFFVNFCSSLFFSVQLTGKDSKCTFALCYLCAADNQLEDGPKESLEDCKGEGNLDSTVYSTAESTLTEREEKQAPSEAERDVSGESSVGTNGPKEGETAELPAEDAPSDTKEFQINLENTSGIVQQ